MKQTVEKILRELNLSENEVRVFLVLLKLKKSTSGGLIQKTGLNFMTFYRTIDKLIERGFVTYEFLNNKQKLFAPVSFKVIFKKLENQYRKFRKMANKLQDLNPFLQYIDLDNCEERIQVKYGKEEFKKAYFELIDHMEDEYHHIGSIQNLWSIAEMDYDCPEEKNFIKRRIKRGTFARILNKNEAEAEKFLRFDSLEKRKTKLSNNLPVNNNYLAINENQAQRL